MPDGTSLEFKPVPGAPPPDEAAPRRLRQMRAIINRFGGEEVVAKERCELRLLPQPIDRYALVRQSPTGPSSSPRSAPIPKRCYSLNRMARDGITRLADCPAPDHLLVHRWYNRLGRRTGSLQHDSPYTASNAHAEIPGLDRDGGEVKSSSVRTASQPRGAGGDSACGKRDKYLSETPVRRGS